MTLLPRNQGRQIGEGVKQFSRCTNCRQWYVHHAVTLVEIVRGNGLQRTTLWCESCIRAAEQRSQITAAGWPEQASSNLIPSAPKAVPSERPSHDFQQLLQEHLDLMERALHEDDGTIIPLVQNFVQRCETYQAQLDDSDHVKRLASHMKYWSTFLNTIHQSGL